MNLSVVLSLLVSAVAFANESNLSQQDCINAGGIYSSDSVSCECPRFHLSLTDPQKNCALLEQENFSNIFHLSNDQLNGDLGRWCSYLTNSPAERLARTHLKIDAQNSTFTADQKSDPGVFASLYTPERAKKAQNIFLQVKDFAAIILNEKLAQLPAQNPYGPSLLLGLSQSQLVVSLPDEANRDRLSMMYKFNALTYPSKEIIIGSLIALVDDQPEALFHILAHEVGHVVGPTYLFNQRYSYNSVPLFSAYDPAYPLNQSLQCVSPYAQAPDFSCFDRKSEELSHYALYRPMVQDILQTETELRQNPYVSVLLFHSGKIGCQVGQYEESQADFFGAQIMALKLKPLGPAEAAQELKQSLAFFCEQIWRENADPQSRISPYPPMTERLLNIVLKNTDLKSVIGENSSTSVSCHF